MTQLTTQQLDLQARARDLAETVIGPAAAEVDRTSGTLAGVEAMTKAGFMGMTVPGHMVVPASAILTWCSLSKSWPPNAGCRPHRGRGQRRGRSRPSWSTARAQKRLAADHVLSGDKLAICITEPDAGSAATQMTRADRQGNAWVLNGTALDHRRRGLPPGVRPGV